MPKEKETPPKGTPPEGNEGGNGGKEGEGNPKNLTPEEHQAELDRVAAKTRAEVEKKGEKTTKDAVKKALEEERRQAKLSEEEKEKELGAKKEKEFKERENKVTLRENRSAAIEKFTELGLSPNKEVVDVFVGLDIEKQEAAITSFVELHNKSVKDGVAEAMKGDPPKDPNTNGSPPKGKDDLTPDSDNFI